MDRNHFKAKFKPKQFPHSHKPNNPNNPNNPLNHTAGQHKNKYPQDHHTKNNNNNTNNNTNNTFSFLCNELHSYFFTHQLINYQVNMNMNMKQQITKDKTKTQPKNKKITTIKYQPYKLDTLFWCYYILKHNISAYEIIEQNLSFVIEKKHKIDLVEHIRENKSILKPYKLTSIDHIEDQLVNQNKIDMETFFSLCYLDRLQVFYFNNKCYTSIFPLEEEQIKQYEKKQLLNSQLQMEELQKASLKDPEDSDYEDDADIYEGSIYEQHYKNKHQTNVLQKDSTEVDIELSNEEFYILKKDNQDKYYLQKNKFEDIAFNNYYRIDNILKPIRCVSAYTVAQLKEMCAIFNISCQKKKKSELYDELKKNVTLNIKIEII